ncbi:MAG: GIY-YIG nuclease family protein [Thaumarchaeota archaeon]|nr:GIY-YIG nuclease family protein [Nitrososphaerota archaeon]
MPKRRHYVYILTCSDGTLYTGYTTDMERRLEEHNSGNGARYTRGRGPVVLSYLEESRNRGEALRRELMIKRTSRSTKLLLCGRYSRKSRNSVR